MFLRNWCLSSATLLAAAIVPTVSVMSFSHLCLGFPLLLFPATIPCIIVFSKPLWRVTSPSYLSFYALQNDEPHPVCNSSSLSPSQTGRLFPGWLRCDESRAVSDGRLPCDNARRRPWHLSLVEHDALHAHLVAPPAGRLRTAYDGRPIHEPTITWWAELIHTVFFLIVKICDTVI